VFCSKRAVPPTPCDALRVAPLIIVGCGYIGTRTARAALEAGRTVRVCGRSTGKLVPLGDLGAQVKFVDAGVPKHLTTALSGLAGATVVYSIPPVTALPPGLAVRSALQAAYGGGAGCFIYFSSSGLYGDSPDDDVWIDEDTPVSHDDRAMQNVLADEKEIRSFDQARLRTVILRLAPVYGAGRGMRARLRAGDFKILGDGSHATSRIHIDDVTRVVFAAEEKAPPAALYLVADDEPTTQGEYAKWLCDRLGVPLPPSREIHESGKPRVAHRNRKLRNTRMKTELGVELKYPSYRDGEAAIEAAEIAHALEA
jgi:nucleoside-diphosphate-sugar epimerase